MRRLSVFFVNLCFLLIALFLDRIVFLFSYFDLSHLKIRELLSVFLVGLRFDFATAAYIAAPFSLLIAIPFISRQMKYLRFSIILNLFWLISITIYLFIDFLYYPFSERHLTFEIFNTGGDIFSLLKIGLSKYIPDISFFTFFIIIFSLGYFVSMRKILKMPSSGKPFSLRNIVQDALTIFIFGAISVVMARGGVQMKPLKFSDAYVSNAPHLGNLVLNGVYTTLRTLYSSRVNKEGLWWKVSYRLPEDTEKKGQEMIVSFKNEELVDPAFPLYRHFKYRKEEFKPLNVVIFIMESWSGKFVGSLGGEIDAMPFFSRLSREGLLFKNFFANGQRSIEAVSAILTSIPPWGGLILSQNASLSQMHVRFLPSILEEEGYKSYFIHGAKYGSMGFSSFMKQAGVRTYISREDIEKDSGRDDGVWGIYDEDTFLYAHRLFERQKQPFFAVIFSLSSHLPYKLPSKEFEFYGKDMPYSDFLNSLRYSDHALSDFFEKARSAGYFKDTLFIIVGDHTEGKSTNDNLFNMFHVPCLIYAPYHIKPKVVEKPATQIDLTSTILDILHSSKPHASIGNSALSHGNGLGLLSLDNFMVFVKDDRMLLSTVEDTRGLYDYHKYPDRDISKKESDTVKEMQTELHYYIQFVNDLVTRNALFPHYMGHPEDRSLVLSR